MRSFMKQTNLLLLLVLCSALPGCFHSKHVDPLADKYARELDATAIAWRESAQIGFDGDGCPRRMRALKIYGYELSMLFVLHRKRKASYKPRLDHLRNHSVLAYGAIHSPLLLTELDHYLKESSEAPDVESFNRLLTTARLMMSDQKYISTQREAAFLALGMWAGLLRMYPSSTTLSPLLERTYLALDRKLGADDDPLFSHAAPLDSVWRDYRAHIDVSSPRRAEEGTLSTLSASVEHLLEFDFMHCGENVAAVGSNMNETITH